MPAYRPPGLTVRCHHPSMWRSIVACLPHDPGCPSNHRARSDRETGAPRPAPRFCSAKQRPTGHSPRERESRARISRAEILLSQRGPRQHPVDAPCPIRVRCSSTSRPTSLRPLPPPSCGRGGADAAAAAGGRHVVAAGGPCGQVGPGVIWRGRRTDCALRTGARCFALRSAGRAHVARGGGTLCRWALAAYAGSRGGGGGFSSLFFSLCGGYGRTGMGMGTPWEIPACACVCVGQVFSVEKR